MAEPASAPATRARLLRDSTWIFGAVSALLALLYVWVQGLGVDSHAYWLAWRGPMYTTGPMTEDAFLYSPAFAQALWLAVQLPWPVFSVLFSLGLGVVLAWLLAPLGWRWGLPLWLAGLPEITAGNVFILLALAAVGFRRPEAWVLPALTKVTVCVGPAWFLVRGEWRRLALSSGTIAAVAAVSAVTAPDLWSDWLRFLVLHAGDASRPLGSPVVPPALLRVPVGLALLVWGARTNRTWVIPVAMLLCTPVLWLGSLTLLAAVPRLRQPIAQS